MAECLCPGLGKVERWGSWQGHWTTFTKLTTDSENRWEKSLEVKYSRVNPKTLHPANPDVKSQKDTILSQNFTMLIQNFTFKAKFREGKEVTPGITWFTEVCLRVYPVVCSSVCEPNLPCDWMRVGGHGRWGGWGCTSWSQKGWWYLDELTVLFFVCWCFILHLSTPLLT